MRINGKREEAAVFARVAVAHCPFNCDPRLALVKDDRLVVHDAMLVQDMRVDTDCMRAPTRIDTSVKEMR